MAGSSGGNKSGGPKKARIEIIPLIDVIFFLLATFVLFTLSLNKIQSMPVDLPQVAADQRQTVVQSEDTSVTLQLSEGSTAYWNKEAITTADLGQRLRAYKAQRQADARVLITGDDKAYYGAAVMALDEVRKANIEQVSIETTYRATGK